MVVIWEEGSLPAGGSLPTHPLQRRDPQRPSEFGRK